MSKTNISGEIHQAIIESIIGNGIATEDDVLVLCQTNLLPLLVFNIESKKHLNCEIISKSLIEKIGAYASAVKIKEFGEQDSSDLNLLPYRYKMFARLSGKMVNKTWIDLSGVYSEDSAVVMSPDVERYFHTIKDAEDFVKRMDEMVVRIKASCHVDGEFHAVKEANGEIILVIQSLFKEGQNGFSVNIRREEHLNESDIQRIKQSSFYKMNIYDLVHKILFTNEDDEKIILIDDDIIFNYAMPKAS